MKRSLIVALLCLFAGLFTCAESIKAPRGFVGEMYNSTLALYGVKDGTTRFLCTTEPFEKISGGYNLISAGHCVQSVPADVQFFVAEEIGGPLTSVKVLKAYLGDGLDFSEFELKTNHKYSVFVLGDEHDSRVGDPIINPNFALGLGKQLSFGTISSDVLSASPSCPVDECAGSFLVQTYGGGGSSGSAVISAKTQQVIGLITWQANRGSIGFGVQPISTFYKFLADPNQPHPGTEQADATPASLSISTEDFQNLFGEEHPFMLAHIGPDGKFTQAGYKFDTHLGRVEIADFYYNMAVFIDVNNAGYFLTSTNTDHSSIWVTVVSKP